MRGRRVPVASAAVSSLNMPAFFGACKWQLVRHPVEPTAMSVVRTDDRVGVALRRLARQAQSEDNKVIKQGAVPRPVRPCNVTQHSLFLSLLSSCYGAAERCSECRQLVEITREFVESRMDKACQVPIPPCISPCYQGSANRDAFADDCLHRHQLRY